MSRKLIALLSALSLIFSFSVLPVAADHNSSKDQEPEVVPGNPNCATVYGSGQFVFEVKLEPVEDGTHPYSFNGFTGDIILDVNEGAKTFDYTITGNAAAVGVIVKGGPDGNWYDYIGVSTSPNLIDIGPQTSDQDLHAPRRNGGLFGLSHISFCLVERARDPNVETTSSETGTILPGTSVTDTAKVTGVTDGPVPTGDVTFFLCQPATVTTNGGDCSAGGDQVGAAKTLGTSDGLNPPSASATSDATTNTTTEGKYCWRAEYEGDTNYNAASHTNSTTECFTVDKATPTIQTTSSETGTVLPGTSVTDTAKVTGVTDGPVPTGDVTFFLCQPATVTTNGGDCSAGGDQVGAAKTLGTSDGLNPPSASATSDATTNTTTEGKYCWRAEYEGDTVYDSASHTNSTTECFTVAKNTPDLATAPWVIPQDDATLSDLVGSTFTTLTFELFDNNTCTGTPVYDETVNVTGNDTYSTSNTGDSATDGFAITSDGTFYWVVSYAGDDNNSAVSSACGDEVVVVDLTP